MSSEPHLRPVPADDMELARAAAAGDREARRRLVERVLDRTRRLVHYLAGRHPDADDLVQNAMVDVLRGAGTYRGECPLERWSDRVVVHAVLSGIASRRVRESRVVSMADPPEGDGHDGRRAEEQRQLRARLADLLERLLPERRVVVVLHWIEGYTVHEIAQLTDAPVDTVRDRLRVGKRELRAHIERDPAVAAWAREVAHASES